MANVPFFTQAAILDQFIAMDEPGRDPAVVEVVLDLLRTRPDLRSYFFRHRPHPSWVPLLWEQGFFSAPPEPDVSPDGAWYPFWEAQNYLLSLAPEVPEYVLRHADAVPVPSPYAERVAAALPLLPPSHWPQASARMTEWLRNFSSAEPVAEYAGQLARRMAEAGDPVAFDLFSAMIEPFPNAESAGERAHSLRDDAISSLRDYHRQEADILDLIAILQEQDYRRLAGIVERALRSALRIERRTRWKPGSTSWRAAIEASGQNHHLAYKDDLVDWLRDALDRWARVEPRGLRSKLRQYQRGTTEILRRLALHVLANNPDTCGDMADAELLRPENHRDYGIHHEFMRLLAARFPIMDANGQREILQEIMKGPEPDTGAAPEEGTSTDESRRYRDWWVLRRLWMIRASLEGAARTEFSRLLEKYGEPEHPDFLTWSSGVFTISDVSPLPEDRLQRMPASELLAFLATWEPDRDQPFGPERVSREGLSRTLAGILLQEPHKYSEVTDALGALDPEYAYAYFRAAVERAKGEGWNGVDWRSLITVCEDILVDDQVRATCLRDGMVGWRDVRQAMVELVSELLDADSGSDVADLMTRARDLLITLSHDPDPDGSEANSFADGDPMTQALNHVRPAAVSALISYAHWKSERQELANSKSGGEIEPAVAAALDDRLADRSPSVRSVFGRFLMLLWWLDRGWLEKNLQHVFSCAASEEEEWLYTAAWDSYVVFNQSLYPDLFEMLRPHYERAISNLKRGLVSKTHLEPARALASHLIFDYFRRAADSEGTLRATLLHTFFDEVNAEYRGKAAWVFWRTCKEYAAKQPQGHWWPAARALWESRVQRAASENFAPEFQDELTWLSRLVQLAPPSETLSTLWPMLQGSVPYIGAQRRRWEIWDCIEDYLAVQVKDDPSRSIELYVQMHERATRPFWASSRDQARIIMEAAAAAPESRKQALGLMDTLARRGELAFRDIYEHYAL